MRFSKSATQTHTSRIHHRGRAFLFLCSAVDARRTMCFYQRGRRYRSERGRSRLVYFMYHSHASLTLDMHRHAKVRASRKLMRRNKLNQHLGGKKKWERDENVNPRVVHTLARRGEGKNWALCTLRRINGAANCVTTTNWLRNDLVQTL
jgi:hypothetical protein